MQQQETSGIDSQIRLIHCDTYSRYNDRTAFVYRTWRDNIRKHYPQYVLEREFYRAVGPQIMTKLRHSTVLVAELTELPDECCAFIVVEGTNLHYVFVKPQFRRLRIAHKLLTNQPLSTYSSNATHPAIERMLETHYDLIKITDEQKYELVVVSDE